MCRDFNSAVGSMDPVRLSKFYLNHNIEQVINDTKNDPKCVGLCTFANYTNRAWCPKAFVSSHNQHFLYRGIN